MSGVDACPEHDQRTRSERHLRYCFSIKHHGGQKNAAQWVPDLSHEDEFAIFDDADFHELADDDGNLYGLRRDAELNLLPLGTFDEQITKFWWIDANTPWHGSPLWHLKGLGPGNRKTDPIPKEALEKMQMAGFIQAEHSRRLRKGKNA